MKAATSGDLRFLLGQMNRSLAGQLLALTLVAAITESFGLLLLVPVLGALGDGTAHSGALGMWLARIGVPQAIGPLLAIYVVLVLLRSVVNHLRALVALRFEVALIDGLRTRAWNALLHCDWRVLSAMRQSDNAGLLITSIDRISIAVSQAVSGLATGITLAALCLAAIAISPAVVLAGMVSGALVLVGYRGMRRRAGELGEQLQQAYADIHGSLSDNLDGLRVIKSFGMETRAAADGVAGFGRMRRAEYAYLRDFGLGHIALQGGGAVVLAGLVWLAINHWHASTAAILPLVALFARALPMLGSLQETWQNWAHGQPMITSVRSRIAEAEAAREPEGDHADAPAFARDITFDRVTVRFASREQVALDQVSFTIPADGITALTGPSGAGKSTVADLLAGLISPDSGAVMIDGHPLEPAQRRAWRTRVTYVQQEPVVFFGTIRDNLMWATPNASEADCRRALEDASAGFVAALPQGLDTLIGDGGHQLSGGERQRVVLARALLRQPSLLILDETTSALDEENERAIAGALVALKGRLTVVIISHRGSLAAIADQTITLQQGRVVGGTIATHLHLAAEVP
ncbi:MAG: ABC transporter ATP-binding protein [Novosphingobium sp.]